MQATGNAEGRVKKNFHRNKYSSRLADLFVCLCGIVLICGIILKAHYIHTLDGDNVPQTYSLYVNGIAGWRNGTVSLWNPNLWAGFSSIGNQNTECVYLLNWILCRLFYMPEAGIVSYTVIPANLILHLSIMYCGVYRLGLKMKLSRAASCFAACTAIVSSSILNNSILLWVSLVDCYAWAPWVLVFTFKMFESRTAKQCWRNSLWIGCCFAIIVTISPAITLIWIAIAFAIACFFKLANLISQKKYKLIKRYVVAVLLAVAVAVLMSAVVLLSTVVFLKSMSRYVQEYGFIYGDLKLGYQSISSDVVPVGRAIFYGNATGSQMGIMLVSFLMILVSTLKKNKGYAYWYVSLCSVIFTLYSLGVLLPVIVYNIPGINGMREPCLAALYAMPFLGIWAGFGFDTVREAVREDKRTGNCVVLLAGVIVLVANILHPEISSVSYKVMAVLLLAIVILLTVPRVWRLVNKKYKTGILYICVALCIAVEVGAVYKNLDQNSFDVKGAVQRVDNYIIENRETMQHLYADEPGVRITQWMGESCYPDNLGSVIGFNDILAYLNPTYSKATKVHENVYLNARCAMQNIKYVLNRTEDPAVLQSFHEMYSNFTEYEQLNLYGSYDSSEKAVATVFSTNSALGSAWLVNGFEMYDAQTPDAELFEKLNGLDFSSLALVNKDTVREQLALDSEAALSGSVVCEDYSNDEVRYSVNSDRAALMVTADIAYDGWKAYIDGKQADMLEVNYMNRGVVIPSGEHVVEFKYEPEYVRYGIIGQIMGCLLIIVVLVLTRERKSIRA